MTTLATQSARQITTWEDEGGCLEIPVRLRPRRRRRWRRWGTALGTVLEHGWSKLWIYNPTRWSLVRTAAVFLAVLFAPVFFAVAILPMLVVIPVAAFVLVPVVFVTFLLR